MRKGFLTQSKKDTTGFGPLHDERSTYSPATEGWGHSDMDVNADPWVKRFQEVVLAHQVGIDSDKDSTSYGDENPYRNIPDLPYKTSREPMNALGCYYSQNYHTSHLKMSDYYFTWNDENPKSHLLLWTTIFVCPLSGELFMSGKWPGNDAVLKEATPPSIVSSDLTKQGNDEAKVPLDDSTIQSPTSRTCSNLEVRWMKKKKIAEHGAAAWAFDCFQHRHKESAIVHRTLGSESTVQLPKKDVYLTSSIGSESPYLEDMAIRTIPIYVPAVIRHQIEERLIDINNDRAKYGENRTNETEEELAWCSPNH